ncbi:MAG: hypothetical protein KAY37_05765 [Phycisphaerae bacterium]|nr:hypothetical protein [Phycisphaerae bacterium]
MRSHETEWRVHNLKGALVNTLLSAAVLLAAAPANAQETLYFADIFNPSFSDGYLRKVNTDGSGLQTLVNTGGGLRGVAVNRFAGKVYWGQDVSYPPYVGKIMRMNLDGSNQEDVATDLGMVTDLTLPAPLPGDLNGDGDVDLDDFNIFADCMTGPVIPTTPGCEPADLHADDHVDLADFAVFQQGFTGPL